MKICFACPSCARPDQLTTPLPIDWQCPDCDHLLRLMPVPENDLRICAVCANAELYKKKDFPHWLGLTLLSAACLAFVIGNYMRHQWWAWAVLIASAICDGLLYLCVGDALVCYRCEAYYRGLPWNLAYLPFELGIAERYRQERLRRQQLQAEKKARG